MRLSFNLLLLLLLLSLVPKMVVAEPLQCSAPTITNLCNSQDVDQSGSTGALLSTHAFNPIDLFSGNKYLRDVDLYAHPEAPDLELVRHYNAMTAYYGSSWTLSYDARLLQHPLRLQQANGTVRPLNAATGQLQQQLDRWIWHYANGDSWHFNSDGWLIQIHRAGHEPLLIQRQLPTQRIAAVQQGQHQLHFQYDENHQLQQVHSPDHGAVQFHYEENPHTPRLSHIQYPDGRQLHYHYEPEHQGGNPLAITGKSIQLQKNSPLLRVRHWKYDAQGRAIFYQTEQPHQWINIDFPDVEHPQQTRLHSENGITYVDFASPQDARIQKVHGASCWACPPPLQRTDNSLQIGGQFTVHHAPHNESRIQKISGSFPGWPDLQLHYNDQGQLQAWQTALQQPTELFYQNQKAHRMRFANGDTQQVDYNRQQRAQAITYTTANQETQTQITYPSPQHVVLKHPHETEQLQFNAQHQLLRRHIKRQLSTPNSTVHWHYEERFHYEEQPPYRLLRHELPEGGALHYVWDSNELQRLEWENSAGQRTVLLTQLENGAMQYANGLQLVQDTERIQLIDPQTQQVAWQQQLKRNTQGLIEQKWQQLSLLRQAPVLSHYLYNPEQQLVVEHHRGNTRYYAWDQSGALARDSQQPPPHLQRDASGLVTQWQKQDKNYILRYNAMRQLHVVYNSVDRIQKNTYNAAGFRIYAQHYPQASQQFFLYDNKKIVAEFTTNLNAKLPVHAAHPVSRRYVYWQNHPIALLNYEKKLQGEVQVIHSDHLAAPHVITTVDKTVLWAAEYDAFGVATPLFQQDGFVLNLRREGQYFDVGTGWHQNGLRTYLPEQGHYLEPDPLGPNPASQLLGYAKQQPLNHTDPWGLILFAFDGTRYDQSSGGVIHQLHQAALDTSFYIDGPGNSQNVDLDALIAYSANGIIKTQWSRLLQQLQYNQQQHPSQSTPIDIIGFSRGAALSLHFANQIMAHTQQGFFNYTDSYGKQIQACIQPRFMGLLDTVAQMGILGGSNKGFDFTVSPAWQWVTHAVALHEYRALFPVHSLGSSANRQEIGLVGSHADLGGGYPEVDDPHFMPLSDVALQWLLWNAQAQGMHFNAIDMDLYPRKAYMHDESSWIEWDRSYYLSGYSNSIRPPQTLSPHLGYFVRKQTQPFIDYDLEDKEKINNRSAVVDLPAYYDWLEDRINWRPE